jgi:cytochrome P450
MVRAPTVERHDRLRRIAHRALTPREIKQLRESVGVHVERMLAPVADGVLDVAAVAYHLPLALITEMLGCPSATRADPRLDRRHQLRPRPLPRGCPPRRRRLARVQGLRTRDR